jgi:hypothetical protein
MTPEEIGRLNMFDFIRLVTFAESVKEVRDKGGGW